MLVLVLLPTENPFESSEVMPVVLPVSAPKVKVRVMALIRCTAAVLAPGRTIAYSGENPSPVIDLLVPLPV